MKRHIVVRGSESCVFEHGLTTVDPDSVYVSCYRRGFKPEEVMKLDSLDLRCNFYTIESVIQAKKRWNVWTRFTRYDASAGIKLSVFKNIDCQKPLREQ